MQRVVLGRYLGVAAEAVPIVRVCQRCGDSTHGRPNVPGGPDYSVSHSGHWVLVAVTGAGRVGIDIEQVPISGVVDELAGIMLSANERLADVKAGSLLQTWTRKEAVVKATGAGIADLRTTDVSSDTVISGGTTWHVRDVPAPLGYSLALATNATLDYVQFISGIPDGDSRSMALTILP